MYSYRNLSVARYGIGCGGGRVISRGLRTARATQHLSYCCRPASAGARVTPPICRLRLCSAQSAKSFSLAQQPAAARAAEA